MVLLLTNDDGIDAPGLAAMQAAVQHLGQQITDLSPSIIMAPQAPHSGCGHQVTTQQPILMQQRSPTAYAIAGTPVDCVRLGISQLFPRQVGHPVDWVLSGINAGGNLGSDVYISGTVAAAREAALHRIPAIAISHYRQAGHPIDWALATQLTVQVLATLWAQPTPPRTYWNVNLPHLLPGASLPKLVFCPACTQPLPAVYRLEADSFYYAGRYSERSRDPGGDVDQCFSGHITITQLQV
jgi:5'-nucleotidase